MRAACRREAAADFLSPRLEQLHDPFLFRNMRAVCDRLRLAADGGNRR